MKNNQNYKNEQRNESLGSVIIEHKKYGNKTYDETNKRACMHSINKSETKTRNKTKAAIIGD